MRDRERDEKKFDWVGMIFDFVIGGGIGAGIGAYIWFRSYRHSGTNLTTQQAYLLIGALAVMGAFSAWVNRNNFKYVDWTEQISNCRDVQFMVVVMIVGVLLAGLFIYSKFFS
jgi:hypothetical protein